MVVPQIAGAWNAQMYANRLLDYFTTRQGFVKTVNTSYNDERKSFNRGDTIQVKKRQAAETRDETDLSFTRLNPGSLQIKVDQYRHQSFETDDWDIAYAGEELLEAQLFPNVDKLAESIDAYCLTKAYQSVGNYYALGGTIDVKALTQPQVILHKNKAPIENEAEMHYRMSPTLRGGLLELQPFTQFQGAGPMGVQDQRTGQLTNRYGFQLASTQLIPTHTAFSDLSTTTLAVVGNTAAGAEMITLDAGTLTGTIKAGDLFTIAGDTTVYSVLEDKTASGNALASLKISPGLQAAAADNAVVTVIAAATTNGKQMNLAYHTNAFAFVAAPMPRSSRHMASCQVGLANDPQSGLSLRVLFGFDMTDRTNKCVIDVLFGFKTLNPLVACRVIE